MRRAPERVTLTSEAGDEQYSARARAPGTWVLAGPASAFCDRLETVSSAWLRGYTAAPCPGLRVFALGQKLYRCTDNIATTTGVANGARVRHWICD